MSHPRIIAVLSGGGVKAAAHLGAMRALLAEGMTPTHYVGTSMGAVIGCGLAAGLSPEEVSRRLLAVSQREIFALDRTSLLKGMWARALLRPEPFRELDAWVTQYRQLWTARLDAFGAALERKQRARTSLRRTRRTS